VNRSDGAGTFPTTLSFLPTLPGLWQISPDGFTVLSVVVGEFLFKDLDLLGLPKKLPVEDEVSLR
jgi:uncharacterized membrane protein YkgB